MWTNWYDITKENIDQNDESAGAYYIRAVSLRNKPIPVRRIIGCDPKGTLYIGMTGRRKNAGLLNRLWGFCSAIIGDDLTAHVAGARYYRHLKKRLPKHKLQYSYRQSKTDTAAKKLEKECLDEYERRYGELPPLNRTG